MTSSAFTRWNGAFAFFGFLPSPLFFARPLGCGVVFSLEPFAGVPLTAVAVGTEAPSSPVLRFFVTDTSSFAGAASAAASVFFVFVAFVDSSDEDSDSDDDSSWSDSEELDEESESAFFFPFGLAAGSASESEESESDESEESEELESESESESESFPFLACFLAVATGLLFAFLSSSSSLLSSDSELDSSSSLGSVSDDGGDGDFALAGFGETALALTAAGFAGAAGLDSGGIHV